MMNLIQCTAEMSVIMTLEGFRILNSSAEGWQPFVAIQESCWNNSNNLSMMLFLLLYTLK